MGTNRSLPKKAAGEIKKSKLPYIIAALAAIFLIIVGLSSKQQKPKMYQPPVSQANPGQVSIKQDDHPLSNEEITRFVQERRPDLNQWLAAAESIAVKSQDSTAEKIISLLKSNNVLAQLHPEGVRFMEAAKPNQPWFGFVLLYKGDTIPNEWRAQVNLPAAAFYQPDLGCIIIKNDFPCSFTWKGIMLLHEGNHAGAMTFAPYDWTNSQQFTYAEMWTHEFQNGLMSKLGGEPYQKLLESEISRLAKEIGQHGSQLGYEWWPSRGEYSTRLDKIFGTALSVIEKDARQTHFWIHACFALLDREFKGTQEQKNERKAQLMYSIYREGGVVTN